MEAGNSSRFLPSDNRFAEGEGRNTGDRQDALLSNEVFAPPPQQLMLDIKQMLQATQEAQRSQRQRQQHNAPEIGNRRKEADSMEQLQAWAASDDLVFRAEALRQLARLGYPVEDT